MKIEVRGKERNESRYGLKRKKDSRESKKIWEKEGRRERRKKGRKKMNNNLRESNGRLKD